ncbi:uncharacterized protein CCOS01_16402 [Colletotrichum costaricense]|uniref:Uncharacterized protein n=1 Tax=Colletotrichum costaricense TaxID=1209916 RepID=A0AAI9YFR2_9PEZI|nr:uncharacterized protein CCOS01_16402 [Colletotrichum costaricense]KAI3537303.1 hypothetical protein CSPX01_10236 [Colletotrichum filicis]KAK1506543.1 hypothetical protein CCOS01_16402 [Colletotrichum costaricense]
MQYGRDALSAAENLASKLKKHPKAVDYPNSQYLPPFARVLFLSMKNAVAALDGYVKIRSSSKAPSTVIATECMRMRDTDKIENKKMHRLSAHMVSTDAYLSADIGPSISIPV